MAAVPRSIGNNSSGKTAALSALNCMFSENSGDRILQRSDFHLPKEMAPDEMESQKLYVEAVFEFEELKTGNSGGEYVTGKSSQHTPSLALKVYKCKVLERCRNIEKAPSRDHSQDGAFLLWIRANISRRSRR